MENNIYLFTIISEPFKMHKIKKCNENYENQILYLFKFFLVQVIKSVSQTKFSLNNLVWEKKVGSKTMQVKNMFVFQFNLTHCKLLQADKKIK